VFNSVRLRGKLFIPRLCVRSLGAKKAGGAMG